MVRKRLPIWTYHRNCKRCKKSYKTKKRTSHICNECNNRLEYKTKRENEKCTGGN